MNTVRISFEKVSLDGVFKLARGEAPKDCRSATEKAVVENPHFLSSFSDFVFYILWQNNALQRSFTLGALTIAF